MAKELNNEDRLRNAAERREGAESLSRALRLSLVFVYALALVMLVVIAAQSFLIVKQHEVAVVYRFGKLRGDVLRTGLHLIWPYPIEEADVFQVTRARKIVTNAFQAAPAETTPRTLKPGVDGFLITADTNVVHAKCELTYYVNSDNRAAVLNYFTRNVQSERKLKILLENAVIKGAATTTADEILFQVENFRSKVAAILRDSLATSALGVHFENRDVVLATSPPEQAKAAFNALNQASQKSEQTRDKAESYKIKTVRAASSQAESITAKANSRKIRILSAARADAATFEKLLAQYERHPALIRDTLYEEAMYNVFRTVKEKFILRAGEEDQVRVMLSRNLEEADDHDE